MKKHKSKTDQENEFIAQVESVGVERWWVTYERGHWYYGVCLKNGETRYWTDLTDASVNRICAAFAGKGE